MHLFSSMPGRLKIGQPRIPMTVQPRQVSQNVLGRRFPASQRAWYWQRCTFARLCQDEFSGLSPVKNADLTGLEAR
jgi:hypothetical protein